MEKTEKNARFEFLKTLAGQYGSRGEIKNTDTYFSKWYNSDWNKNTPWCACFLSWGAAQQPNETFDGAPPRFAKVDDGMIAFQTQKKWRSPNDDNDKPIPGDYVFFDWDRDSDPDHVGAVLCEKDGFLYTIEGNSSGRVALNCYPKNDPRIMGYGVLNWKT